MQRDLLFDHVCLFVLLVVVSTGRGVATCVEKVLVWSDVCSAFLLATCDSHE